MSRKKVIKKLDLLFFLFIIDIMIYFIKQIKSSPIRIGITLDIEGRIQKLQAGSSKKLTCLKIIRTEDDYRAKHLVYLSFSRIKETNWFYLDVNLKHFLRNLEDKKFYKISELTHKVNNAQLVKPYTTKIEIDVDLIKQHMKSFGYNQEILAKKIKITKQAISLMLMAKQTSSITAEKLIKIFGKEVLVGR
jgi:DNA-binding XRE family transcriptional regulator